MELVNSEEEQTDLVGHTDAEQEQQEQQDENGNGDEPLQTVEEVLANSHEALKGVKPEDITKAIQVLCRIDDDRKDLNAERMEEVELLESKGFPRKALYAIHARCKASPLVRAAIDPAYNYGCDVMDVKLQNEMFPKH